MDKKSRKWLFAFEVLKQYKRVRLIKYLNKRGPIFEIQKRHIGKWKQIQWFLTEEFAHEWYENAKKDLKKYGNADYDYLRENLLSIFLK